jgi:hypothetical protein
MLSNYLDLATRTRLITDYASFFPLAVVLID